MLKRADFNLDVERFIYVKEVGLEKTYNKLKEISVINSDKPKFEAFQYGQFQKYSLRELIYDKNSPFETYYSLDCKGINEIVTAIKIKTNKSVEAYIIIFTSCDKKTWVVRDYANDAVRLGLLITKDGKSYYKSFPKKLRTINFMSNVSKVCYEIYDTLMNKYKTFKGFLDSGTIKVLDRCFKIDTALNFKQREIYLFSSSNRVIDYNLKITTNDYTFIIEPEHIVYLDNTYFNLYIDSNSYTYNYSDVKFITRIKR